MFVFGKRKYKKYQCTFQNGVLGTHVKWKSSIECVFQATVSKVNDAVISVVHPHCNSFALERIDLKSLGCRAICRLEHQFQIPCARNDKISCLVLKIHFCSESKSQKVKQNTSLYLISMGVSAYHDWFRPWCN